MRNLPKIFLRSFENVGPGCRYRAIIQVTVVKVTITGQPQVFYTTGDGRLLQLGPAGHAARQTDSDVQTVS